MNVVILGAGGHGRVVLDAMVRQGAVTPVGFIDADTSRVGTEVAGLPVLGPVNLLAKLRREGVGGAIVAIGDNRVRRSYADLVREAGLELITVVHPHSSVSPSADVGRNVLVAAGAIVGPDAKVLDGAIINTSAVVDHDCVVGVASHVAPGVLLAGRVHVGDQAFLGLGAKVLPCMKVGDHATVGAGAVVIEDVPAHATVVGVPARIVKMHGTPQNLV